jgi:hypothetical protein
MRDLRWSETAYSLGSGFDILCRPSYSAVSALRDILSSPESSSLAAAYLVRHVCDLVLAIHPVPSDLQRRLFPVHDLVLVGPGIKGFSQ